jgi:hypothetical protein
MPGYKTALYFLVRNVFQLLFFLELSGSYEFIGDLHRLMPTNFLLANCCFEICPLSCNRVTAQLDNFK